MDDRRPREGDLAREQNPAYRPARPLQRSDLRKRSESERFYVQWPRGDRTNGAT